MTNRSSTAPGAVLALVVGALGALTVVMFPVAVAVTLGVALTVRPVVRAVAGFARRQRRGDVRRVCVPGTGVCVEA